MYYQFTQLTRLLVQLEKRPHGVHEQAGAAKPTLQVAGLKKGTGCSEAKAKGAVQARLSLVSALKFAA